MLVLESDALVTLEVVSIKVVVASEIPVLVIVVATAELGVTSSEVAGMDGLVRMLPDMLEDKSLKLVVAPSAVLVVITIVDIVLVIDVSAPEIVKPVALLSIGFKNVLV